MQQPASGEESKSTGEGAFSGNRAAARALAPGPLSTSLGTGRTSSSQSWIDGASSDGARSVAASASGAYSIAATAGSGDVIRVGRKSAGPQGARGSSRLGQHLTGGSGRGIAGVGSMRGAALRNHGQTGEG